MVFFLNNNLLALLFLSFSLSSFYCYSLYQTHPHFISFSYTLITNRISNFILWFTVITLLITITFILYKIFIGKLETDEVEDVNHVIKYVLADAVMNVAFLQSHIDSNIWVIIILSLALRCLIAICKVRLNNLGRHLNMMNYIKFFILLHIILLLSLLTIIKYYTLLINVKSAKSLFAFELLSCVLTVIELIVKFCFDTITIFYNNVLSQLDPDVIYNNINNNTTPTVTNDTVDNNNDNVNTDDNNTDAATTTEAPPPPPLPQINTTNNHHHHHNLPIWYRYFCRFKPIYSTIRTISQYNTFFDTTNILCCNLIKLFIYLYILFNYYTVILPVYTLRRIVSSLGKIVQSCLKINNILKVRGSLQLMFKKLSLYETTYLTSDDICGVCLVDFEDDCEEAKTKLTDIKFYQYIKYYLFGPMDGDDDDDKNTNNVDNSKKRSSSSSSKIHQHSYNSNKISLPFYSKDEKPTQYDDIIKIRDQETNIGYLSCGHYYHQECIREWLNRDGRCPVCRTQSLTVFKKTPQHLEKLKKEERTLKKQLKRDYKETLSNTNNNNNNNNNANTAILVSPSLDSKHVHETTTIPTPDNDNDNIKSTNYDNNSSNDSDKQHYTSNISKQTAYNKHNTLSPLLTTTEHKKNKKTTYYHIAGWLARQNKKLYNKDGDDEDGEDEDDDDDDDADDADHNDTPENIDIDQSPLIKNNNDIDDSDTQSTDQTGLRNTQTDTNTNDSSTQPLIIPHDLNKHPTSTDQPQPQQQPTNLNDMPSASPISSIPQSSLPSSPSEQELTSDQRRLRRLADQNAARERAFAEQRLKKQQSSSSPTSISPLTTTKEVVSPPNNPNPDINDNENNKNNKNMNNNIDNDDDPLIEQLQQYFNPINNNESTNNDSFDISSLTILTSTIPAASVPTNVNQNNQTTYHNNDDILQQHQHNDDDNDDDNDDLANKYDNLSPSEQKNIDMLSRQVNSLQQQLMLLFQRKTVLIKQVDDINAQINQTDDDITLIQTLISENIDLQNITLLNKQINE